MTPRSTGTMLLVVALACATGSLHAREWRAHGVPLFVSASHPAGHQGFVRIINRSDEAGEVLIDAVDDEGVPRGPVTLVIDAGKTVHFNSVDLEGGNAEKGLSGGIGPGEDNWRLRLRSRLDLEVLAYNRTSDGLLAPLHDLVPGAVVRRPGTGEETMGHRVVIFNPASNVDQVSRLRIINRGEETAAVTIEGIDDDGETPGTAVELEVASGASHTVTAEELESGEGAGLGGMLDDGQGKWQLVVTADQPVEVMNLLSSPTGHLTNLSTEPEAGEGDAAGEHDVPLFAAAANPDGYQGFMRVINRSGETGEVSVEAFDDAGVARGPVTFDIDAHQTVHFNSADLEGGNPDKGLIQNIGEGTGDWRLIVRSGLDIEVLAYNRTDDGLLTTLHDVVPYTEVVRPGGAEAQRHHVAIFNPASNESQASRLRIINLGEEAAVVIEGIDDAGASPGTAVKLTMPPWASQTLTAQELESGEWESGIEASGGLGDGKGKWRLAVTSEQAIGVMSLMATPTDHLVNLSTAAPAGVPVPPPVVGVHASIEVTGRSTVSVGTPMALSVKRVGMSDVAIERYEWAFSDGQRERGEEVTVSFAEVGVHEVTVSAMSGTDVVAQAEWAVAVFDAAAGANPGLEGIPAIFGDVNQDGRFDADDLALAERSVAGERELESEAIEAGDLDLSGVLGERDVELMRQALQGGAVLPSAMLDASAYPGGVVAMVSPVLLDPDADIEIHVDGVVSRQVMRAILGYATFVVPATLAGEDAEVEVVVEEDGAVAERLAFVLKPAVTPTVSAKEDVLAFFAELAELIARQEEVGTEFLSRNGLLSAEEAAIVLGAAKGAARQLEVASAELEALLEGDGGQELAELLQTALHASGLGEFRERTQSQSAAVTAGTLSSAAGDVAPEVAAVCDEYVPAVCALTAASGALAEGASVVTGVCAVGGVLSVVGTIASGGIAASAATYISSVCAPVLVSLEMARVVAIIADELTLGMRLSSELAAPEEDAQQETVYTITAEVTFFGLLERCRENVSDVSDAIDSRIVGHITRLLMKRSTSLGIVQTISRRFGLDDSLLFAALENGLEGAVAGALTKAGVDSAFAAMFDAVCMYLGYDEAGERRAAGLVADGRQFNLTASDGGGLLSLEEFGPKNDSTGTYRLACAEDFTGHVVVDGSKEMCGVPRKGRVTISCNACPEGEVDIPDPALRRVLEAALNKEDDAPITSAEMATLTYVGGNDARISNLKGLECATALERLDLNGNRITDVSPLSALPMLKQLYLDGNRISEVSLSDLASLERLHLSTNRITEVSLSDLPALQIVFLQDNRITDVSKLSRLPALKQLYLGRNRISEVSMSGLTNLQILHLAVNRITDVSLSDLPALYVLYLFDNQIAEMSLSGLPTLLTIYLNDNRITDVSPLSELPALRELDLWHNQITDVSPLSGMPALERLGLSDNPISTVSLSDIPALESLWLAENRISEVSLSRMPVLQFVHLSRNQVSKMSLSRLPNLEFMRLNTNRVTDLSPLLGLPALRALFVLQNPLSVDSVCRHIPTLRDRGVYVAVDADVSCSGG